MKKDNGLGSADLGRLIWRFCIPSLASSLVTAVYNIVDQIFIGNDLGEVGNAAANAVFPAVTMLTALSLMCGVGTSALMNLSLGKGETEKAKRAVGGGLGLMVLCGGGLGLLLFLFTRPVLRLFSCPPEVMAYAIPYAKILSLGFAFSILGAAGPFLIRADGSPVYALATIAGGAVLNMALDYLFVVRFKWSIRGAAWATWISQGVSAAMVLAYMRRFQVFRLSWADFVPRLSVYLDILRLGAGPACNFATQSIVQIVLNSALSRYGDASGYGRVAVLAVAGVANKVNTLATAVFTGLTNGMQPIVSFNYGRKDYGRVTATIRQVIGLVVLAGFVIFLGYQLFPVQIAAWFSRADGSEAYYAFAKRFFRVFYLLIFLNGLQSSVGGAFSAQGKPAKSILISLTRQIFFLPPMLLILPVFFGMDGILAAGPLADGGMAVLALLLLKRELGAMAKMEVAYERTHGSEGGQKAGRGQEAGRG